MLKKRIIGVIVVYNGIAVQSIGFSRYLPIGRPEIVAEYLSNWGVDEIAVADINAYKKASPNVELVRRLSSCCYVPLTYGGGIRTVEDMIVTVQAGADKVMINQAFLSSPELVSMGAERLGVQCITVSVDSIRDQKNRARVYDYVSRSATEKLVVDLALEAQRLGAGEIFLNSPERDGSKTGFDLELARDVANAINIPVTICGGVGTVSHFADGLSIERISAVAAANFFNYTEHSVAHTKQCLIQTYEMSLRHDSYFSYKGTNFSGDGRLCKKDDRELKEMLFEFHPNEVI